jgi:effector-binding domain-containing protein
MVSNLGTAVTELFERAEADASRARIDESPFLLFHGDRRANGNLDIEVCIPVDPCAQMPGVRRIDGLGAAGCVVYQGAYSQTDTLFDRMRGWIKQAGATATGPSREVFHRFGADQIGYGLPVHRLARDPADYVTELQIPLVRNSQRRGNGG